MVIKSKIRKIFDIILKILIGLLLLIIVLTTLSALGIPKGFRIFTVMSGSMEPEVSMGSLIFVSPIDSLKKGDIITFEKTDNTGEVKTITHRIYDISMDNDSGFVYYITKGDANNTVDMENVHKEQILGRSILNIPLLGYPVSFAKTKVGVIALILIPSMILIGLELMKVKKEIGFQNPNIKISLPFMLCVITVFTISGTYSKFSEKEKILNNSINTGSWHTCLNKYWPYYFYKGFINYHFKTLENEESIITDNFEKTVVIPQQITITINPDLKEIKTDNVT